MKIINSISHLKEEVEIFITDKTEKVKKQIAIGLETFGIVVQKVQVKGIKLRPPKEIFRRVNFSISQIQSGQ